MKPTDRRVTLVGTWFLLRYRQDNAAGFVRNFVQSVQTISHKKIICHSQPEVVTMQHPLVGMGFRFATGRQTNLHSVQQGLEQINADAAFPKGSDGGETASAEKAVETMSVLKRNNVSILGSGPKTMVFAHGYGCDQNVWRFITPAFSSQYRIVLFDHVGAGNSDLTQYSAQRYGSLQAYARDLLEIFEELDIEQAIYIGHSVSAMIGILAAIGAPERFDRLVLVGPSPCYINDGDYTGGFTRTDIDELVDVLSANYLGWSSSMATVIMNQPDQPELANELYNSFCRTNPEVARQFARVTFLGDNRADLPLLTRPSLILQCADDAIAPVAVGDYMHRQMPHSTLVGMQAAGHCPHMSAPGETIAAIRAFL